MHQYYVYIMASKPNWYALYRRDQRLIRRVHQHRNDLLDGFTKRYGVHMLVYFEQCTDVNVAIWREKCIKN